MSSEPTLEPYPEMKDSGVVWLGDIPGHWEVRRLESSAEWRVSNVDKHSRADETPVRLCNYVDVYRHDRIRFDMPFMAATANTQEIERFGLQSGDVLITKDSEMWNDIAVPALVQQPRPDLLCGYHVALLRPRPEALESEFLFRALSSRGVACQFHIAANGVTRFGLSHNGIKSVRIPVPPLPEQTAVARYLDYKGRRIRRSQRERERLVALLREQRRAVIEQAVTGKIDVRTGKPYPAYKPSGVAWLGDIPAHWAVSRLAQLGRFFKGGGGTKDDEAKEGVPCVRYGDLYTTHQFFVRHTRAFVSEAQAAAYTPLEFGDLLFAASGETLDEIGKSAVNLLRGRACCGGDVIIFRSQGSLDARYLGYAADCPSAVHQKATMGRGITVMHIYAAQLKRLALPVPPLAEQFAIADFLDGLRASIGRAIGRAERQIELLEEYRTRLTSDVVTGKLDVREAAARLPDEDDESLSDTPAGAPAGA